MTEPGPPFLSAQNPAKLRQGRKEALPCHAALALRLQRTLTGEERPAGHGSDSQKPQTLARTALTAPQRRLQAKDDESHGQDANRGLERKYEGHF